MRPILEFLATVKPDKGLKDYYMAHHKDYEERKCKYCGKVFRYRDIDCTDPGDCLYCSNECALADTFPPGWGFEDAEKFEPFREKIRKGHTKWV